MKYRGSLLFDFDARDDAEARKLFQNLIIFNLDSELSSKVSEIKLQELVTSNPPRKISL